MTSTVTPEDLSLFALQLLDEADAQRVRLHVRQTPEAQQELHLLRSDLAFLSLAAEPQAVPDGVRQRVLSAVAREPRHVEGAAIETRPLPTARAQHGHTGRGFLLRLLPWGGWAVAASLAVATWVLHGRVMSVQGSLYAAQTASAQTAQALAQASQANGRAQRVLETLRSPSAQRFLLTAQPTAPIPSARLTYVSSTGSVIFLGSNLRRVPPAKTYELWLIPSGKAARPIPAGTFKPDERGYASLILPSLPHGVPAATFGVTVEDEGGSRTPTLPILLTGS